MKKNEKFQETKARWNAKRTNTELAVAAKAAQALAAVQQSPYPFKVKRNEYSQMFTFTIRSLEVDHRDDFRPSSRSRPNFFVNLNRESRSR